MAIQVLPLSQVKACLSPQDGAEMLFRMYLKYCDRRGWKLTSTVLSRCEVIGLDTCNLYCSLLRTTRYAKRRAGRPSGKNFSLLTIKTQTDIVSELWKFYLFFQKILRLILFNDLRIDVYHASGPGGQGQHRLGSSYYSHSNRNSGNLPKRAQSIAEQSCSNEYLTDRLYEIEKEKHD